MKRFLKKLIPDFLIGIYHFKWSLFMALIYGLPSRKIKVIGVTGTNGKSTVVHLIDNILEQSGYKVASISSIKFKIGDKVWDNKLKMTMPGHGEIHRFLHKAVKADCQYAVLEVTSEGIRQFRHCFVNFNTAVFTNLTPEHIESHGGFEKYKEAKGELFKALKKKGRIIANLDDDNTEYFLRFPAEDKYGYRIIDKVVEGTPKLTTVIPDLKTIVAHDSQLLASGVKFIVKETEFNLNLLGRFNIHNALAAICLGLSEGISLGDIKKGLERVKGIPGRLEIVISRPFAVLVDYAHTPDALEKVYKTVREIHSGRIVGLLGAAGGGRDKWKRLELGRIAAQYCNHIILSNEDPYDEDPEEIIKQIKKGIDKHLADFRQEIPVEVIIDRRQAIHRALLVCQDNDILVITGKGCEPWMCVKKGKKIPWDDRQIVREEYQKIKG